MTNAPANRSLIDELREEGRHLHVVDRLIARLIGALPFDGRVDPRALVRAMRDQLAGMPDGALSEAADVLLRERTFFPSVAVAYKAATSCSPRHMVRIVPGTTAWAAWSAHWHASGHKVLARINEQQGYAMVPRPFPIVEKPEAAE